MSRDHPLANGRCPLGPDFRAACRAAAARTWPGGEVTPSALIGFAWDWAHRHGADFNRAWLPDTDAEETP